MAKYAGQCEACGEGPGVPVVLKSPAEDMILCDICIIDWADEIVKVNDDRNARKNVAKQMV
ncbi:hypothetical protein LCGC14_2270590 [marine sediment metagenome]|uniref:Uncharacterized protein n=1 Tax=marine sediment metagenome TaxID=412755 RepID=A0A0F9FS65_9ZZZZ